MDAAGDVIVTARQARFISWVTEVLLDVVVLNFFVEFTHSVVIDSFWISVATALLLKLSIDAVKGLESRVRAYFSGKESPVSRAVGVVAVLSILFLSKFVILELVDIVFGDEVDLGGLLEIVVIILTMLVGNGVLTFVYRKLGRRETPGPTAPIAVQPHQSVAEPR